MSSARNYSMLFGRWIKTVIWMLGTNQSCSPDAAKVIFKETNLSNLDFLDKITAEILFDVGRMLGLLFTRFSSKS